MLKYPLRVKLQNGTRKCGYVIGTYTQWGPNRYLCLGKKSMLHNNEKGAQDFLIQGLKKYPANPNLNKCLAQLYTNEKKWKKAIPFWNAYFTYIKKQCSVSDFEQLATAYEKVKDFKSMNDVVLKGLEFYPDNKKLHFRYYNVAVLAGRWETAIKRLEGYIATFQSERPYKELIKLSVMHQLVGDHQKANMLLSDTLDKYKTEVKKDKDGYHKVRIFDNGETVIDFYKQLTETNTVIISFDPINKVLKKPSFGFKVLNEQKIDIIAVRKRKAGANQQDLSTEEFERITKNVVNGYNDRIAYGYSLGAYLALYLTPNLNCRILAISPRIPAHPMYGEKKAIKKETFHHSLEMPKSVTTSPHIIFDPKNKLDVKYMNEELRGAFPYGKFIKIPYGGHGMARHLINMGVLKEYIISFIHKKEVPKYDRKNKNKSSNYLRLLAKECLEHNKLRWAENLVNQSLEMKPNDGHALKVKVNLLKRKGLYNEAQNTIERAVKGEPKKLNHRLMLIDYLFDLKKMEEIENVLNESYRIYGRKPQLESKEKKLMEISVG